MPAARKLRGLMSCFSSLAGDAAGVLENMGADECLDNAAQRYAALVDIMDGAVSLAQATGN